MKNNYPMKYSLMKVETLNKEIPTINIVSPCFLIEKITKYDIKGTTDYSYKVVFPYNPEYNGNDITWIYSEPCVTLYGNNAVEVNNVFDSYEEAIKFRKSVNKTLLEDLMEDKVERALKSFNANIPAEIIASDEALKDITKTYSFIENEIKKNTEFLFKNDNKEQKVIQITPHHCDELNISLYEAIRLWNSEDFNVYSLSNEEYELLKNNMDPTIADLCKKNRIIINNAEKKVGELNNNNGKITYIDSLYLDSYDIDEKINFFNNSTSNERNIFTKETFDDVYVSFNKPKNISLTKIKKS